MRSMISYKPGDVVLVPFPFTNWSALKQRPALVISSARFNQTHADIIVCAITSKIPIDLTEFEYILSEAELRTSGLPQLSLIKLGKIAAIDGRLVRKHLGRLPRKSYKVVLSKIHKILSVN